MGDGGIVMAKLCKISFFSHRPCTRIERKNEAAWWVALQFFSMLKYRMTDNLGAAADLMLITTVELMPIASDS